MVEDEFQSIAKLFTQHIHHREYERLKALAKTRNASNINTISRPVDGTTVMRPETEKRKEAQSKASKRNAAVEQIRGTAEARRPPDSDEEFELEIQEDDDDPWVGTTLHGLVASPSRKQTSLTGLQGVVSNTRAAAGYSRPKAQFSQPSRSPKSLPTPKSNPNRPASPDPELDLDATTTDADSDDLDGPGPAHAFRLQRSAAPQAPKAHETPTRKAAREIYYRTMAKSPPSSPPVPTPNPYPHRSAAGRLPGTKRSILKTQSRPASSSRSIPNLDPFNDDDDNGDDFFLPCSISSPTTTKSHGKTAAAKRGLKRTSAHNSAKEAERDKRRGNISEIPVFLV
ncbi:hypothetical protein MMC20_006309 [Loxospora ochrophaea]|nr:hypothetical protein [Loxospora ochrophaea]